MNSTFLTILVLTTFLLTGCNSTNSEHIELSDPIKVEVQIDSLNSTTDELDSLFSLTLKFGEQKFLVESENGYIQLPLRTDTATSVIIKYGYFLVGGDTSVFNNCCYSSFYFPNEPKFFFHANFESSKSGGTYKMKLGNGLGDWNGQLKLNDRTNIYETYGWGQ